MDVDVPADVFRQIVDKQVGGDLEQVVRLYYGRLRRMLELGGFDVDVYKRQQQEQLLARGRALNDSSYQKAFDQIRGIVKHRRNALYHCLLYTSRCV